MKFVLFIFCYFLFVAECFSKSFKDPIDIYHEDSGHSTLKENSNSENICPQIDNDKLQECEIIKKSLNRHNSVIKRLIQKIHLGKLRLEKLKESSYRIPFTFIVDIETINNLKEYLDESRNNSMFDSSVIMVLVNVFDNLTVNSNIEDFNQRFGTMIIKKLKNYFNKISRGNKSFYFINISYFAIFTIFALTLFEFFRKLTSLSFLITLILLQAVMVEWIRLYELRVAHKMAKYSIGMPESCKPYSDISSIKSVWLWASQAFTFSSDTCHEYYARIAVDPMMEITILEAISSTLRGFLGNYLVDLSTYVNKSLIVLLSSLPIQWQFVVFISMILLTIFVVALFFGFELKSPLFGISLGKIKNEQNPLPICSEMQELRLIEIVRNTVSEEISKSMQESMNSIREIAFNSTAIDPNESLIK